MLYLFFTEYGSFKDVYKQQKEEASNAVDDNATT
jgi:hypothetical protein